MGMEVKMSNQAKFGAVIFAKDLFRVARFYEEILVMTIVHSAKDHIVLNGADYQLVIHGIPKKIADSIEISTPPERRTETPIKLFFFVPSLAIAREQAVELGGALNPAEGEWEARGFRACDGHDPEGNVIQFREALS
jgi:predicted enzyme related to lactoylglutathione lyase